MQGNRYVIIGSGPAGHQAALSLRQGDPEARVTLIGKDPDGCYRPRLLPDLIAGNVAQEAVMICPHAFYREHGIKFRRGQRVVGLDVQGRRVLLEHQEVLAYDGLILAVGGRPHIPAPYRPLKDRMLTLKTLKDARLWRQRLEHADSVFLIGGDLTSFAVTRALCCLQKRVFFVLNEESFWPLRFDPGLQARASQALKEAGVEVLPVSRIQDLTLLSDGRSRVEAGEYRLEVDLVGAFFGLVPNIAFLRGSGLQTDRGVLVDEFLFTGVQGVYATGDCAQVYHPEIRDYWVSIGHENAVSLGMTAAHNLLGARERPTVERKSILHVQGVTVNTSWWVEF